MSFLRNYTTPLSYEKGRNSHEVITVTRIYILRWRFRCRRRRRCLSSLLISWKHLHLFRTFLFNLLKSAPIRACHVPFVPAIWAGSKMWCVLLVILFCCVHTILISQVSQWKCSHFFGATKAFRFADHVTKRNGELWVRECAWSGKFLSV